MQARMMDSEKYHIIRELGRGGMGVVYLAEDQKLKRQVALKVLHDHLNQDTAFVERFQEEARSVSTLHHPNIVYVNGLEQANGVVAIDMEFVEGPSLAQLAAETQITPHLSVAIARDVLRGLVTCHDIGVVHRDIKPSNILVHQDGGAKITDFGLATAYASHLEASVCSNTSSGFYMGTPRYMPVDAWEGGEPKPAWDMYSFGLVLYELLSGSVAYGGDNPMAIMKKHLTDPVPSLRKVAHGLSGELTDLVDCLVHAADEQSPMVSEEALEALQKTPEYTALEESNIVPTISVPHRRRLPKAKRNLGKPPWKILGSSSVLVALVFWVVWAFLQPPPAPTDGRFMAIKELGGEGEEAVWMVAPSTTGNSLTITGYTATSLTRMTAQATGDGNWTLSGGWAEFVVPQAGSMQFGAAIGTLYWLGGNTDMHIQLERTRERDGASELLTLVGTAALSGYTQQTFLRAFESDELRQNLLYSELLPRKLDWAMAVESLLPALPDARYFIPFANEEITVDGLLDESLWNRRYFRPGTGAIGELEPNRPRKGPTFLARWNHNAIYLATRFARIPPDAQLEIALLPAFEVSLEHSGRFLLRVEPSGNGQFHYFLGRVEEPADFAWPLEIHEEKGARTVEMKIPIGLLEDNALPEDGKRWRVNTQWFREDNNGDRKILAQWGDDAIMALEHGALFVFDGGVE